MEEGRGWRRRRAAPRNEGEGRLCGTAKKKNGQKCIIKGRQINKRRGTEREWGKRGKEGKEGRRMASEREVVREMAG